MKKLTKLFCVAFLTIGILPLSAQNTKKSVAQVTTTVNVSDNVDYIITGATPFGDAGVVNITNTEHAVLIVNQMKPSELLKILANHVQINGDQAKDGTNCQVKLYNLGAIVMPYGSDFKPLTVYSEQNFEGTAVNNFGLEHSGGYMNTLSAAKLNNKIRSFKLKRGFMVTFSTLPNGRGYSRCFIAADKDLEVETLPLVLDQKISSYRVFKWYDAGKKQLANSAGDTKALAALNVQSTYDWGQGNGSLAPDIEWVPNHIYEDWPSSSTIGGTTQSPHTKNNNEPRNSSDDHPQDLATILNNWENMMRTGLRLCSPASWDGSDYWNATGFLADFLDSIDARGWRCDIIDLHCYWDTGRFDNMHNWSDKYKRPIWISEWCWGASWDKNGAFASGVTQTDVKNALQTICSKMNSWNYVERYYYWNGEADISKLYKNGLTPAGVYYAGMNSGVGYNGKYDFVPKNPRQYNPSKLATAPKNGATIVTWHDDNGEYNRKMEVQRLDGDGDWMTLAEITPNDGPSDYTYTDEYQGNSKYRIHVVDINNKHRYSDEVYTTVPFGSSAVQYGKLRLSSVNTTIGVPYLNTFEENPLVFTGLMTYNSSKNGPVVVPYFSRTAITTELMTYGVSPWLNQTSGGADFTEIEEVPFLIMPAGNYSVDGVDVEAGYVNSGLRKGVDLQVTFQKPFPEGVTPVVIATVDRAPSNKAMMHKIWNVTNTGFMCSVSYEDAVTSAFASPTLAYLAVTPGVACLNKENSIYIAAGVADTKLYGTTPKAVTFRNGDETLYFVAPYIFADLQTKNTPVPTELKASAPANETIDGVVYQKGLRVYRLTDKSVTTTNVDDASVADEVGWVTIFNQRYLDPDAIFNLSASDNAAALRVQVNNRSISVEGDARPDIFTASGARVLPYTSLAPGIYFVRSRGIITKVLVK